MKRNIRLTESQLQRVILAVNNEKKPLNEMDINFRTDKDADCKREIKVYLLHTIRNLQKLARKNPKVEELIDQTMDLMNRIQSVTGRSSLDKDRLSGSLN